MDRWRKFFQNSGVDLWTICERALTVAYAEDPDDFPARRDKLAQKLFAPEKLDSKACEYDAPMGSRLDASISAEANGIHCNGVADLRKNEVHSDEECRLPISNETYEQAEALTEEMEEEVLFKADVLLIKDMLQDSYQSEREIFDSLQRLELMQLSFEVLKETEIGKTVNSLRKHSSKRVRSLAKRLVSDWKDLAEEWYKSAEDVAAAATAVAPASSSLEDEEDGLPSPPMDEGALLSTRTASLEMSQLFDFMDDDTSAGSGNPNTPEDEQQCFPAPDCKRIPEKTSAKHPEYQNSQTKERSAGIGLETKERKEKRSISSTNGNTEKEMDHRRKNGCNGIQERTNNGHAERKALWHAERKAQRDSIEKRLETGSNQMTQISKPVTNSVSSEEFNEKILMTKRKLQKNYQREEDAKKQRTIQVMDLHDLPKGGPNRAKASHLVHGKPTSQQRPWTMGRR